VSDGSAHASSSLRLTDAVQPPDRRSSMPAPGTGSLHLFSLFMQARDLTEDQQQRFIAQRCASDPQLERQLQDLLHDHRRAARCEPCEGMVLADRYTLQVRLGSGSSGDVWCAYDGKLARKAALKIFHIGSYDAGALVQALREAQAASHIVSDHVVRVRDAAWCGRIGAYIDMELCADVVAGQWLIGTSMAKTRPRSLAELVRWVMQAARGVQAAHEQGVFHRDLKPDNVVIRPATRSALVTDFGLALQMLRSPTADPLFATVEPRHARTCEAPRMYAGTPCYMAPEQACGLPADLNPDVPDDHDRLTRIDVYGLGAMLYELLAGRPPYEPCPGASDPISDVLADVRSNPPLPLRRATRMQPTAWRVPTRLERIVQKAMARDPHQRYASSAALAADLECFLDRRPTSLDAGRHLACAALWMARSWRALVPAALLVVAACTFGYTALLRGENDQLRARMHETALQLQSALLERRGVRAEHAAEAASREKDEARSTAAADRARRAQAELELEAARRTPAPSDRAPDSTDWRELTDVWLAQLPPPDWLFAQTATKRRPARRPEPPQAESGQGATRARAGVSTAGVSTKEFLSLSKQREFQLCRVEREQRIVGYCVVRKSNERARACLAVRDFPAAAVVTLASVHARSRASLVWIVDERDKVVEVCGRLRTVGSHMRTWTCDGVDRGGVVPWLRPVEQGGLTDHD
jgi:serine/threonine protein kinase